MFEEKTGKLPPESQQLWLPIMDAGILDMFALVLGLIL